MNRRWFFRWLWKRPFLVGSILAFLLGVLAWAVDLLFVAKTFAGLERLFITSMVVAVVFALVEVWECARKKDLGE